MEPEEDDDDGEIEEAAERVILPPEPSDIQTPITSAASADQDAEDRAFWDNIMEETNDDNDGGPFARGATAELCSAPQRPPP